MTKQHVIFGTGPLGMAIMDELVARGENVRMINRSGKAEVPASVEVVASDAYHASTVKDLVQDADIVYQCAQPAYNQWVEKFPPLQASIIEGVSFSNAVLVFTENLYMYGEVDGPLHEELPYVAQTRKGKVRGEMAKAWLAAHQQGKIRGVSVRGSDFYGPRVMGSALGDRVFLPMVQGKSAALTGDIDQPHTYTFIRDFAKAMISVGQNEDTWGQAWHAPNAPTLTSRQVIEKAFQIAEMPPKISSMGKLMMRIGGLFIPEAREMIEMMYEFEKPFVVDSSKFEARFGDIATNYETGLRETVSWYKDHAAVASH